MKLSVYFSLLTAIIICCSCGSEEPETKTAAPTSIDLTQAPVTGKSQLPSQSEVVGLKNFIGYSEATLTQEGDLKIRGWILTGQKILRVEVYTKEGKFLGNATFPQPRPDIAKHYPEYNTIDLGFTYACRLNALDVKMKQFVVKVIGSNGEITSKGGTLTLK